MYIYFFFLYFINSTEVAKHLNENSYGLIFGVNTFMALVFQSVLTVIVIDERVLALPTRTQVSNATCMETWFSRKSENEVSYLDSLVHLISPCGDWGIRIVPP
jgi:hypothetical protein